MGGLNTVGAGVTAPLHNLVGVMRAGTAAKAQHRHSSNRTADIMAASVELNELNYSALSITEKSLLRKNPGGDRETTLSVGNSGDNQSLNGDEHTLPGTTLYKPRSELLRKAWPLHDTVFIEYAHKQVISKVISPQIIRKSAMSNAAAAARQSANYSISDVRSLRSREAAILGSRMSMKPSDYLLQESLRESIRDSLKESANYMKLPKFR